MKKVKFNFIQIAICLMIAGGSLFYGLPSAEGKITEGYFEGKIKIETSTASWSSAPVKVFLKSISTKTPLGKETNYYGFINFKTHSNHYAIGNKSAVFRVEEVQPGYQVWYKMEYLGERSISRNITPIFEVRQFFDDGDLKLRLNNISSIPMVADGLAYASAFEVEFDDDATWVNIPMKGRKLEKNDLYDGIINPNAFLGHYLDKNGNFSLVNIFTGVYSLIDQSPSAKARKGYVESKKPLAMVVPIFDDGDYKFYFFDAYRNPTEKVSKIFSTALEMVED